MLHRCVEEYDILMDEGVLLANDMVAAYNAVNEAHFDEAYKVIDALSNKQLKKEGTLIYLFQMKKRL